MLSQICTARRKGAQQVSNRDRFDKFTEPARRLLHHAQEEAQRFQHSYIGTEHLLLGLLGTTDSVAIQVLESMGIELQKVRSATEFIVERGDRIILGEIGLTPRAKRLIESAVDEARQLHHPYIGTEHLLLALIDDDGGPALGALESMGIQVAQVHAETLRLIGHAESLRKQEPPPPSPPEGQES